MITALERRCLDFVAGRLTDTGGVSPSYAEIAAALSLKSKSGVFKLIEALEAAGKIRRLGGPRCQRALEVVDLGETEAVPLATYPDAAYFKWDDEAKELKPWKPE